MKLIKSYLFSIIMFILLILTLVVIVRNQYNVISFREKSVEHVFLIDLKDECGLQEMTTIQRSLEDRTYQPVYSELVDQHRQVYRVKLKATPDGGLIIFNWLLGRQWIEGADKEIN